MYRSVITTLALLGVVALLPVAAQNAATPSDPPASTPRVQASLLNTVKASKAKPNEAITAQTVTPLTLKDGTVIPAGSTLLGHVLKTEADSADQHASSITIKFDSVRVKKKEQIPVNFSVVSAMAPPTAGAAQGNKVVAPSEGPLPADHPLNGQAYNVIQDTTTLASTTHGHSGISGADSSGPGKSTTAHTGSVIGMPGVSLQIDDGPEAETTFVSTKKNLQLDSGLQLMLVVP